MKHHLPVGDNAVDLVARLQEAGYETYIVGGAVRDLLLGRSPKDYDISTAASPEEVRAVFGRRMARIIGKRFRLVHVTSRGVIYEVSTFRQAPEAESQRKLKKPLPENMITSDNSFGTAEEDAWRRDFTVNALFYDPMQDEIVDFTGQGVEDIEHKVVRAIGEPKLRFEEDPVRMLRALKLVGQYGFELDEKTENALFESLDLIRHASPSRLSLELEKVLGSIYGDRQIQAFHDYGLLNYFLPEIERVWGTPCADYALDLLAERNCRVDEGRYRNSVSLAMATLALPFVEHALGAKPGELWQDSDEADLAVEDVLNNLFKPLTMMNRMTMSADRVLRLQPFFESEAIERGAVMENRSYPHARELMMIRNAVEGRDIAPLEDAWPKGNPRPSTQQRDRRPPPRKRRGGAYYGKRS